MKKNIKQKIMKRSFEYFNRLSVKQIKTYAAVIMMSTLSFDALATVSEEEFSTETGMVFTDENVFSEELSLENWMLVPFEASEVEETAVETYTVVNSEAGFEEELDFEAWMSIPFETNALDEVPVDNSLCNPAP